MPKEFARQMFHLVVGGVALGVLLAFGKNALMAAVFFTMLIGFIIVNQVTLGRKIGVVKWFVDRFERKNPRFHGWGSACYGLGVLILASFMHDPAEIASSIVILAVGDSFSTIFGRNGWHVLPWSKSKTVEGTLAFIASSLPAYYFVGWIIVPAAVIAAIVESIDWPIDDNIMVPIACVIFFLLV